MPCSSVPPAASSRHSPRSRAARTSRLRGRATGVERDRPVSYLTVLALTLPTLMTQASGAPGTYEEAEARGIVAAMEGRLDDAIAAFHKCLEQRPQANG